MHIWISIASKMRYIRISHPLADKLAVTIYILAFFISSFSSYNLNKGRTAGGAAFILSCSHEFASLSKQALLTVHDSTRRSLELYLLLTTG